MLASIWINIYDFCYNQGAVFHFLSILQFTTLNNWKCLFIILLIEQPPLQLWSFSIHYISANFKAKSDFCLYEEIELILYLFLNGLTDV